MAEKQLKTRIQLLKNTQNYFYTNNPKTLNGEIYIVEDGGKIRFKIGTGSNYNDISFYDEDLLALLGFDLKDVVNGQIIMYNSTTQKWENVNLTDEKSIIYLDEQEKGLSIKGYKDAAQGYMLVKDTNQGLAWIKPLSEETLNQKVAEAAQHATNAGNYATAAGNSAISADTSARTAERINQQTMQYVNDKFWWGTIEEYNQLEEITEGSFYFVQLA